MFLFNVHVDYICCDTITRELRMYASNYVKIGVIIRIY